MTFIKKNAKEYNLFRNLQLQTSNTTSYKIIIGKKDEKFKMKKVVAKTLEFM